MEDSLKPVGSLRNIGPTVEQRLTSIGVVSRDDLAAMGPVEAYRRLSRKHPDKRLPVCYYLYSLEAALRDVHWDELTTEEKRKLRDQAGVR